MTTTASGRGGRDRPLLSPAVPAEAVGALLGQAALLALARSQQVHAHTFIY